MEGERQERIGAARGDVIRAAERLVGRGLTTFTRSDLVREARRGGSTVAAHTLRSTVGLHLRAEEGSADLGPRRPLARVGPGRFRLAHRGGLAASPPRSRVRPKAGPVRVEPVTHPTVPVTPAGPTVTPVATAPSPAEAPSPPDAPLPTEPPAVQDEAAPVKDGGPGQSAVADGWWSAAGVQRLLVRALDRDGWTVADPTLADSPAPWDLAATNAGAVLLVAIEGAPSDPARSQTGAVDAAARRWFADAVLGALATRSGHDGARVAVALPALADYGALALDVAPTLGAVGIEVWLIDEDARVATPRP